MMDKGAGAIPPTASVTVVITTRDRGESILTALRSVLANTYARFDVQIVDQSRDAQTCDAIQPFLADPRVYYTQSATIGASRGRNIGIQMAWGSIIAVTDDDCEVPPDWIERLVTTFAENERVGVVFGMVEMGPHNKEFGTIPYTPERPRLLIQSLAAQHKIIGLMGACLGMRHAVWEAIGGYDEYLGAGAQFPSAEDIDVGFKALAAGHWVLIDPHFRVIHHGFRAWPQYRRLVKRDMYGIGGMLAKHTKQRKWAIFRSIYTMLAVSFGVFTTRLVRHHRLSVGRFLYLGQGFAAGLRMSVDTHTGNFVQ